MNGQGQPADAVPAAPPAWAFLTNHARVLICVAANPDNRISDIASCAGITQRRAQLILTGLEKSGYITRRRVGRRNTYTVETGKLLPHPDDDGPTIGDLIALFTPHTHRNRPGPGQGPRPGL